MDSLQMHENDSICNVLELVGLQNECIWWSISSPKRYVYNGFLRFSIFCDAKERKCDKCLDVICIMLLSFCGVKMRVLDGRKMVPNVVHIMILAFFHVTSYQTLCV